MNKITKEHIEDLIKKSKLESSKIGNKTTIVCLTLPNGFEITETSSCVDVSNYDMEIGTKICLGRIQNKIWELEGYLLQSRLFITLQRKWCVEKALSLIQSSSILAESLSKDSSTIKDIADLIETALDNDDGADTKQ